MLDRLNAKVEWAKQHVDQLEPAINRLVFGGSVKYSIRHEDDPNTGDRSYYVTSIPDVPVEISLRTGDILNNLRCALDHLACHLVLKGGGKVTGSTGFPIADSAAGYLSEPLHRKIDGMGKDAIDAIGMIEPYKGGKGHTLWQLARLNNRDKHRLLLTACSTQLAHSATPTDRLRLQASFTGSNPGQIAPDLTGHLISRPTGVPLKAGAKLLTVSHAEIEEEVQFLIGVAFDEPEIVQSEPVVPLLRKLADVVEGILTSFDRDGLL